MFDPESIRRAQGASQAGESISSGIGRFFGGLGGQIQQGAQQAAGALEQQRMEQFQQEQQPEMPPIGAMFESADSEQRQQIIDQGIVEEERLRQQADEIKGNVEAAKQAKADAEVRENLLEIQRDPSKQESIRQGIALQLGVDQNELVTPGESGNTPIQNMQEVINDLILSSQENIEALKQKQSILLKEPGQMTKDEKLGLGLVALLPLMVGMMTGGRDGLQAGIAGLLGGTGAFFQARREQQAGQMEQAMDLEQLIQQQQGQILKAAQLQEDISMQRQQLSFQIDEAARQAALTGAQDPRLAKVKENQWKAAGFATRMEDSLKIIDRPGDFDPTAAIPELLTPEGLKSEDRKVYEQAALDFSLAQLRRESGAAIKEDEIDQIEKIYIPTRGDDEKALARKAQARRNAFAAMKAEAGDVALKEVVRRKEELGPLLGESELPGLTPEELEELRQLESEGF